MTHEEIKELAGHRDVSPWIMKLVCDAVAKERERYMPLLTELAHIVRTSHLYGPEMKKLLEQEEAIRARGEA